MSIRVHRAALAWALAPLLLSSSALAQYPKPAPPPYVFTAEEKAELVNGGAELGKRIARIRSGKHDAALLADVEIYHKAITWMLRYPEEVYNRTFLDHARLVLERGLARAKALEESKGAAAPWTTAKGHVPRAYRSRVDGSLQPYAVVVPAAYDGRTPIRLDVVLHGRDSVLSEASFLARHERPKTPDPYTDRIELHVFGRTNNAYRWSGETDVYEALADVRKHYRTDPDRTVLRGFSMGGAGTWHIGLHDPSRWAGIEAGAGFTETIKYAKQPDPPPYVRAGFHIYDAMDYARNAFNVPTVGYGGEIDAQLQASVNIKDQLQEEKVDLGKSPIIFLVGPNTPHRFHPDSKRQSDAFLDSHLPRRVPEELQFVTYTARYANCAWITVGALEHHYSRAEVFARRSADGVTVTTRNVAALRVENAGKPVTIDGQTVKTANGWLAKSGDRWAAGAEPKTGKRHGVQGPIDDAFLDAFLAVKPTGTAWNAGAADLAAARLNEFRRNFAKWLRADIPEADDQKVTEAQIRDHNLILFGDPGSNKLIGRIAAKLPIHWDKDSIHAGGQTFDAKRHLLVLIAPNPLNPNRYVVVNSGHTFGEKEFQGTNALLFPRLGDWAVLTAEGQVAAAGLFSEEWKLQASKH